MQDKLGAWLPELKFGEGGKIDIDPETQLTSIPGVYAGGDAANGGAEVVNAVADGKRAALHLHQQFTGEIALPTTQTTRYGASSNPYGSGFNQPIRVKG